MVAIYQSKEGQTYAIESIDRGGGRNLVVNVNHVFKEDKSYVFYRGGDLIAIVPDTSTVFLVSSLKEREKMILDLKKLIETTVQSIDNQSYREGEVKSSGLFGS